MVLFIATVINAHRIAPVGALARCDRKPSGETMSKDEPGKKCPMCGREMTYVKDGPTEITGGRDGSVVSLASTIYFCAEHGLFRAFMRGAIVPFSD